MDTTQTNNWTINTILASQAQSGYSIYRDWSILCVCSSDNGHDLVISS